MIAIDAQTGEPCSDFGKAGRVALREGIGDAEPWEGGEIADAKTVTGLLAADRRLRQQASADA